MALSSKARSAMRLAMRSKSLGDEVSAALDAAANDQAAYVAPMGATSNLVGVDGTGSNAAPLAGTEARLDAIEAKIDAILAGQVASGQMAAS